MIKTESKPKNLMESIISRSITNELVPPMTVNKPPITVTPSGLEVGLLR